MIKESEIKRTVVIETALLKALSIRENYESYIPHVVYQRLLPETQTILDCYQQYYELYGEHREIDFTTFITQFSTNWHAQDMNPEDHSLFKQAILNISNTDHQEAESALLGLVNKQFVDEVKQLGEKSFTPDQVHKAVEAYETRRAGILSDYDKDCFKLEELDLSIANPEDGIPWGFTALQEVLYGQVQGDLVILNAHHGIGKSAFMYTQMVHTLQWLHALKDDRPILFFNSEGSAAQGFGRFLSCLYRDKVLGGYKEILERQDKVKDHFFKKYGTKQWMIFRSNGRGFGFIRDKIKKYNAAIVFIDMFKGAVSSSKTMSETGSLEDFAQRLRDLSAVTCPIWATVQAGDSAMYWDSNEQRKKHKRWPDSTDIYGSKTGIQGAASTIISIGMDDERPLTRFCHTTKVKAEENAKFICTLEKKFSFYRESDWRPKQGEEE